MTAAERRQLARIRSVDELRAYLKQRGPKAKKLSALRAQRISSEKSRRSAKNAETAAIRVACMRRAQGQCECGCGRWLGGWEAEMDHFYGRARGQSVEKCWMLCRICHRDKTENKPSAFEWGVRWINHCLRHHYPCKARITHAPVARRQA